MVPFSAPGRLGRRNLPAIRWTKIKPTPTATNSRAYAIRGVIRSTSPSGRRLAGAGVHHQFLPAGETGVQLVPVADLGLAQAPAEVDHPAVHAGGEIDQAEE